MPSIAVIDDRKDARDTMKINLDIALPGNWTSIDIEPFKNIEDYPSWIIENEIVAFLLDERLHEQSVMHQNQISYSGHDLVDFIRKHFSTFPIFIVTAYPDDPELLDRFKDVEDIIERTKFNENYADYVPRVIRSAQKYLDTFENELSELSKIAAKIAHGKYDDSERNRLKAIQAKIGFAFPTETFIHRSELLDKCEKILKQLEDFKKRIDDETGGGIN